MKEILEARAKELAERGAHAANSTLTPMLVSEWPEQKWAFPISLFRCLLESSTTPCPQGVTFNGFPCSAFLYFQSKVYPVVPWSRLVGLPQADESSFAVATQLGLALEISAASRVTKLDLSKMVEADLPYCGGRVEQYLIANLEDSF